jgi:hypothetical protein
MPHLIADLGASLKVPFEEFVVAHSLGQIASNALVSTEPIKSRMGANGYLRMPVAREKPRLCRT